MRLVGMFALMAASVWAQAVDPVKRGEQLFGQTCGSGYCHGGGGGGGGAPRLAARGFTPEFIRTTVTRGVPGTAMNAFATTLPAPDVDAIVAYVAKLNGVTATGRGGATAAPVKLTPDAVKGKALFSEAARGFGRCSTCHEAAGSGLAVAAPMQTVPASVTSLKGVATPNVATITVKGETMPGLVVAKKSATTTFYDLTVAPPVLRTDATADVRITEGSTWKHSGVVGAYSDSELASILAFLRTAK